MSEIERSEWYFVDVP